MSGASGLPRQFVVAGTDTGVGKTLVSAMLVAGLGASYWKPIQSGLGEQTDSDVVHQLCALSKSPCLPEAYRLDAPLSPHAAAAAEGISITRANLRLPKVDGRLIVEGAGGLMVPINRQTLLIDLIVDWSLPVLLVARNRLGVINHTLLSLAALRRSAIEVIGVVLNGGGDAANRQAIETYGEVEVVAEIPALASINQATLRTNYAAFFGRHRSGLRER